MQPIIDKHGAGTDKPCIQTGDARYAREPQSTDLATPLYTLPSFRQPRMAAQKRLLERFLAAFSPSIAGRSEAHSPWVHRRYLPTPQDIGIFAGTRQPPRDMRA